ncbi:MAG: 23S rRNA (pseudouridine(1915)-N(3))-methyltransferase RlmH [Clostridia bacterium]|nr:23S rRNA (pseudouridine(1915)-N(3))-methyltransferase RlmH [Clostridia bacterium]
MVGVSLIAVGSLKERYFREAAEEYSKRLSAYCSLTTVELKEKKVPDDPSEEEIRKALEAEGREILSRISKRDYVIVLAVEGRSFSSEGFASKIGDLIAGGTSRIVFVIGSSWGLSGEVKDRADLKLSVSEMTFPHQMMRPIILEILYRCFGILAGSKYHK